MSDLFAATAPDTTVRWKRVPDSSAYFLFHPCSVCGAINAPFGEGVSFRKSLPGRWWCADHWRQHLASEARR